MSQHVSSKRVQVPFFDHLLTDAKLVRWCQTAWDEEYYQKVLAKTLFPALELNSTKPKKYPLIPELERIVAEQQMEAQEEETKIDFASIDDIIETRDLIEQIREQLSALNKQQTLTTQIIQMRNVEMVSDELMDLMSRCGDLVENIRAKCEVLKQHNQLGMYVGKMNIMPLEGLSPQ